MLAKTEVIEEAQTGTEFPVLDLVTGSCVIAVDKGGHGNIRDDVPETGLLVTADMFQRKSRWAL